MEIIILITVLGVGLGFKFWAMNQIAKDPELAERWAKRNNVPYI
jgi:hypothetical protein